MITAEFLAEFRDANKRRAAEGFAPLKEWTLQDWLACLLGEIGEAANAAKKIRRLDDGLGTTTPEDREKLIVAYMEEICDCFVYLDLILLHCGDVPLRLPSSYEVDSATAHLNGISGHLGYWLAVNEEFESFLCETVLRCGQDRESVAEDASDFLAYLIAPMLAMGAEFDSAIRAKFNQTSKKVGSEVML